MHFVPHTRIAKHNPVDTTLKEVAESAMIGAVALSRGYVWSNTLFLDSTLRRFHEFILHLNLSEGLCLSFIPVWRSKNRLLN
jgi:hypothetical protein